MLRFLSAYYLFTWWYVLLASDTCFDFQGMAGRNITEFQCIGACRIHVDDNLMGYFAVMRNVQDSDTDDNAGVKLLKDADEIRGWMEDSKLAGKIAAVMLSK